MGSSKLKVPFREFKVPFMKGTVLFLGTYKGRPKFRELPTWHWTDSCLEAFGPHDHTAEVDPFMLWSRVSQVDPKLDRPTDPIEGSTHALEKPSVVGFEGLRWGPESDQFAS